MEREKILDLINEINKIARLKVIAYKIEEMNEKYDEFIEDFYFIEWLRLSTDLRTQMEEVNNTLVLFEELLEELEIAKYNVEDKLYNKCMLLLQYNKKDLGKIIKHIGDYKDEYIVDVILNFAENNFYEIDEEYFVLEIENLLQGGQRDERTRI